jgi:hypothetical protein
MKTPCAHSRPSGETVPAHVAQHYEAIRQHEQLVRQLEAVYFDARRACRQAKDDFDTADAQLRNLIAEGLDPQGQLPFPSEPPADEAWRAARIEELHLPAKLREKLIDAGVETIGQLENLRAEIALAQAVWPKGFTTNKISAVEDSVIAWLTEHRDHFREPIDAPAAA